jgi:hypothetical protein
MEHWGEVVMIDKECSKRERWENKKFNEIDDRLKVLEKGLDWNLVELQKQIAELKEQFGGYKLIFYSEIDGVKEVLREFGNHYRENLIYIKNHTELWDFNIEELDELLEKLDAHKEQTGLYPATWRVVGINGIIKIRGAKRLEEI